jgi:hypothetical protein
MFSFLKRLNKEPFFLYKNTIINIKKIEYIELTEQKDENDVILYKISIHLINSYIDITESSKKDIIKILDNILKSINSFVLDAQ